MRNNRAPDETELQTRFNQRGFLAGRNMLGDAYPTMDVSLSWPLIPQLSTQRVVLPLGVPTFILLARPTQGRHAVITRATLTLGAPTAGDSVRLIFRRTIASTAADPGDIILSTFVGINGNFIPLIGGAATVTGVQIIGSRPVYVPPGFDCAFIATSAAGDSGGLNWILGEFPETQPLTSLLAGF